MRLVASVKGGELGNLAGAMNAPDGFRHNCEQ